MHTVAIARNRLAEKPVKYASKRFNFRSAHIRNRFVLLVPRQCDGSVESGRENYIHHNASVQEAQGSRYHGHKETQGSCYHDHGETSENNRHLFELLRRNVKNRPSRTEYRSLRKHSSKRIYHTPKKLRRIH